MLRYNHIIQQIVNNKAPKCQYFITCDMLINNLTERCRIFIHIEIIIVQIFECIYIINDI